MISFFTMTTPMNTDNNFLSFLKKLWLLFSYIVVSEGVCNAQFWEAMTQKDTVQSHVSCIEIFSTQLTCTSLERAWPMHGPLKKYGPFSLNIIIILIILISSSLSTSSTSSSAVFCLHCIFNQINFQEFVVTKQAALKLSLF